MSSSENSSFEARDWSTYRDLFQEGVATLTVSSETG